MRLAPVFALAACLCVVQSAMSASEGAVTQENRSSMVKMDDAKHADWLARWDKNITSNARNRYCDKAKRRIILKTGGDPRLHGLETVVRELGIDLDGKQNVRVDGVKVVNTL